MNRAEETAPVLSTRPREAIRSALRLIDAGHSIGEVAQLTHVHRLTLERAMVQAKARQALIRQHLQSRSGLTSLLRYPDRGPWGKGSYFGNCTGYLVFDLLDYFKPRSVFDPMEGSGTTGEVCFDLTIEYVGRDLKDGFDLLSSPLPDQHFDLIFWHPPYCPAIAIPTIQMISPRRKSMQTSSNGCWKDCSGYVRCSGLRAISFC